MRLEFIPKTHGKITDVEPMSAKRGQTDMVPAVAVWMHHSLPTDKLPLLNPTLKDFLYEEGDKKQGELVPTLVLTAAAKAIGALNWAGEQTGSQLNVYYGVSGDMNQVLKDGTVDRIKITPKDGGWDLSYRFYSEKDIDEDVIGGLGVLKNHEVDIELIPPEIVDRQPDLMDQANQDSPEKALARGTPRKGGKQTPAQAAAAHLGHDSLQ